jgi:hypothetical protein
VADLPGLWSATTTTDKDRNRLLGILLGDATITRPAADATHIDVGLRWKSVEPPAVGSGPDLSRSCFRPR